MKKLLFLLFGLIAFSAYSQVTITEEEFAKLPTTVQQQLRPDSIVNTSSIGKEIGTAINETLTTVSDNVIKVAESEVGQTAIGIAMWKLLWKDVTGIVVGIILIVVSIVFGHRATKRPSKEELENDDEDEICTRHVISAILAVAFFIASMCCIFG